MATVVSHELVATQDIPVITLILTEVKAANGLVRVIQYVKVEVCIPVIIKKSSVSCVPFIRNPELFCLLYESKITLVDK